MRRFGFHGYMVEGDLPGESVRAWWAAAGSKVIASVTHALKAAVGTKA